jgi:hypothetical protein
MKRLGQRVDVIGGYPLFDALFDIEDFIVGDRIILDLIFGNLMFRSYPRILALFKVKQSVSNFFRTALMGITPMTNLSTCLVLYLAKAFSTTLLARHLMHLIMLWQTLLVDLSCGLLLVSRLLLRSGKRIAGGVVTGNGIGIDTFL